jgi:hypothetical protein
LEPEEDLKGLDAILFITVVGIVYNRDPKIWKNYNLSLYCFYKNKPERFMENTSFHNGCYNGW